MNGSALPWGPRAEPVGNRTRDRPCESNGIAGPAAVRINDIAERAVNVFVVDSDLKRRAQLAFSLSKACITATPLDPSDRIDLPAQEPCLFLVCDLDETRALQRRIPARSCLICYADGVELRNVVAAMKLGAREYFSWPDDVNELIARVRQELRDSGAVDALPADGRNGGFAAQAPFFLSAERHSGKIGSIARDSAATGRPAAASLDEHIDFLASVGSRPIDLSNRELEVLRLASHGLSSQLIGERLGIRRKTVETHRANILMKTRSSNMAEAVRWGIESRII